MPRLLPWLAACLVAVAAFGQEKKADPKDAPRVVVAAPPFVPKGATTKVTLRGLRLDNATEVRAEPTAVAVKLLSKGKADVPDKMLPEKVGNTQVAVEVTVPVELTAEEVRLIVITPQGAATPQRLLLPGMVPLVAEKEPNPGFREAQVLTMPVDVDGTVSGARDVDVYRLEGKAGDRLMGEVVAGRLGSPLDATLALYGADGRQVAWDDDSAGDNDPRFEIVLPRDGVYYLSLIDAHDQGGGLFSYRLRVRVRQ